MPSRLKLWFDATDARDAEAFASFLSPDVEFVFANAPAPHGRGQVQTTITGFFSGLAGLRHELSEHWQIGDQLIMRGTV